MGVSGVRSLRAATLVLAMALLAACTPSLRPAPSTVLATPSTACVDAWLTAQATPSDQSALDATMRACRSLEEFAAGDAAARAGGNGGIDPKVIAQLACASGRFNDTPICRQLGIAPSGSPASPGA
jgi:hypothetical protein